MKGKLILFATIATIGAAAPAFADDDFTTTPVPPGDTRNSYVPPSAAVYVVNQMTGTIQLCYPDTAKDGSVIVACTAATKLSQ